MKRFWILCIVTCVMAVGIASCNFNASTSGAGDIVIASKDFTEIGRAHV